MLVDLDSSELFIIHSALASKLNRCDTPFGRLEIARLRVKMEVAYGKVLNEELHQVEQEWMETASAGADH